MNCEQARELAALAASGDVTPVERRELDTHTAGCAECLAEVTAFNALCGQLAAMREKSASEAVYSAVRARVVAEIDGRTRRRWISAWPAFAAVVAASLILAVMLRVESPVAKDIAPPPSEMAASVQDAEPAVPAPLPVRRIRRPVARPKAQASGEPVVVRLLTNDPAVVIYWIADAKREGAEKEIMQ